MLYSYSSQAYIVHSIGNEIRNRFYTSLLLIILFYLLLINLSEIFSQ